MATNEQAPAKSTTHLVIGFIGLLAVMLSGGVIYFVCTNASALTSGQPTAAAQWILPVLISFASIPLTALVTMSTVRSRGEDPAPERLPDVAPPDAIQPLMMSGPGSLSSVAAVDLGNHVPGSQESMTAGVIPPEAQ